MTSVHIQFRLNDASDDPNEPIAMEILEKWKAAGWEPRAIITQALLRLEGIDPSDPAGVRMAADEFRAAISELRALAKDLRTAKPAQPTEAPSAGNSSEVSAAHKTAIFSSLKPGRRPGKPEGDQS